MEAVAGHLDPHLLPLPVGPDLRPRPGAVARAQPQEPRGSGAVGPGFQQVQEERLRSHLLGPSAVQPQLHYQHRLHFPEGLPMLFLLRLPSQYFCCSDSELFDSVRFKQAANLRPRHHVRFLIVREGRWWVGGWVGGCG